MGVEPTGILDHLTHGEKALYNRIDKEAEWIPKRCLNPKCNSFVKKKSNHIVQKNNGVLESLCETDRKLWILESADGHTNRLEFFYKGLSQILVGNMFCNFCDSSLFKEIETTETKISSELVYLYSLRSFLWEFRKIENHLKSIQLLKDSSLSSKLSDYFLEKELNKMMLLDALNVFYSNIFTKNFENIIYKYRIIERVEIACSSSPSIYVMSPNFIAYQYFLHIIPYKDKTILIIATAANCSIPPDQLIKQLEYIDLFWNFEQKSDEDLKSSISKILLKYVEDWACSNRFYQENIKHREKEIIKAKEWYLSANHNPKVYELMGKLNSINLFS